VEAEEKGPSTGDLSEGGTEQVGARPNSRKRLNFELSQALYDELQRVAASRGASVSHLLRAFIRLGLKVVQLEDNPGAALILREDDREREIVLF